MIIKSVNETHDSLNYILSPTINLPVVTGFSNLLLFLWLAEKKLIRSFLLMLQSNIFQYCLLHLVCIHCKNILAKPILWTEILMFVVFFSACANAFMNVGVNSLLLLWGANRHSVKLFISMSNVVVNLCIQ